MQEDRIQSMQSKLNHCETDNQGKVILEKELNSCRDELTDEHNAKQQIYQDLQGAKQNIKALEDENKRYNRSMRSANRNIETLKDEKKVLQNQLNSEKAENDNLRNQIRQLKKEKSIEVGKLSNQNQDLQNSLDSCQVRIKSIQSELDQCQTGKQWNSVPNRIQQLENLRALARIDLWHENFVGGEYVIAYEMNSFLDSNIKRMLPKVRP